MSVKFKFCCKQSAAKFLCVKTFRSKVIATSFLYLTVHRWIAGDVPIYLKINFALKVTHSFRKHRFRLISLNSASVVRASENSSIITDRKPTMRFPSNHRWTLCVTPKSPKGSSKREFLHRPIFSLPVISLLQVIVDISNLVSRLIMAGHSLGTKNSTKQAWSRPVIHFKFQGPKHTSAITKVLGIVK